MQGTLKHRYVLSRSRDSLFNPVPIFTLLPCHPFYYYHPIYVFLPLSLEFLDQNSVDIMAILYI
jgi:hypothetical protein